MDVAMVALGKRFGPEPRLVCEAIGPDCAQKEKLVAERFLGRVPPFWSRLWLRRGPDLNNP